MGVEDFYRPGGTCRNCGSSSFACKCQNFNIEPQQPSPDLSEVQRLANKAHFIEAIDKCCPNQEINKALKESYATFYPEPKMQGFGCAVCGFSFEAKRKPRMCPDCGGQGTLAKDPK